MLNLNVNTAGCTYVRMSEPTVDTFSTKSMDRFELRKRNWSASRDYDTDTSTEDDMDSSPHKKQRVEIRLPSLAYPPSLYTGWTPPRSPVTEHMAIDGLLEAHPPTAQETEYTYITLSNFHVYRPQDAHWHPGTMAPLSDLLTRQGNTGFVFDGVLSRGNVSYFVQGVPFSIVSVEGYDEQSISVRQRIYLRTDYCGQTRNHIWYKLASPAKDYARFHNSYLWLADFTKHFICYLQRHSKVCLDDFKHKFHDWLAKLYGKDGIFRQWRTQYAAKDFRTIVVNNLEYLWKESTCPGVDEDSHNRRQPLWKEIDHKQLEAVPKQPVKEKNTVVTPYVYDLFKSMYFGDQLESRKCIAHPAAVQIINPIGIDTKTANTKPNIRVGDIVCLCRDNDAVWKDNESTWYAYVHDMEKDEQEDDDILHLFWLYRPSDTTCGNMRYPYENELFFSDHCNCTCARSARIYASDVKENIKVTLFAKSPTPANSFFIRQTYMTEDDMNYFITLDPSHLTCRHRERPCPTRMKYDVGNTVLISLPNQPILEPVEIVGIEKDRVRVRELLRRRRYLACEAALPNELVYTRAIRSIAPSSIVRKCHIRCYTRGQTIPAPYSYGGVGDCWILTGQLSEDYPAKIIPLNTSISMSQGFDPGRSTSVPSPTPLRTLDLFCGGGSFGRGIEEGGAAKVLYACDYDAFAIHTKRANLANPNDTRLFFGSAVDYYSQACSGKASPLIARIGEIELIIAGSPCQGFSLAQKDRMSSTSKKNASMVALVVAFIDLYRPKYALLENVFGMTRKVGKDDVFAQIICALVGLGYQVQYHIVDAFAHGSPQNRSRIFISVAAPGLTPLASPPITHAGPPTILSRRIGTSLAGMKIGSRQFTKTPFTYVSASEATKDLPPIEDGQVGICVQFPDHRLSRMLGFKKRTVMPWIPTHPYGSSFVSAIQSKLLPTAVQKLFEDRINSVPLAALKIYRRLHPNHLFDTCTTVCKPDDARDGRWVHWFESRPMSIMEVKRAQSFPDHEPLIGLPAQQWKLIGNGVSRYVATAWGMSLRATVLENERLAPLPPQVTLAKATLVSVGIPARRITLEDDIYSIDELARSASKSSVASRSNSESESDSDSDSESDSISDPRAGDTIVMARTVIQSLLGAPMVKTGLGYTARSNLYKAPVNAPKSVPFRAPSGLSQSYTPFDGASLSSNNTDVARSTAAARPPLVKPLPIPPTTPQARTPTAPSISPAGRSNTNTSVVPVAWPKPQSSPEKLLGSIKARAAALYGVTGPKETLGAQDVDGSDGEW